MTDSEILTKAIEKARKNGYRLNVDWKNLKVQGTSVTYKSGQNYCVWQEILFDHDFAKAFWKDECTVKGNFPDEMKFVWPSRWKAFLQQMVLEENPIKYLEKFL